MRTDTKWCVALVAALLAAGCKKTLGPDEVDESVPRPTSTNEPAGFTPVANRGFNHLVEDNWIWGGIQGAYAQMDDAGAPHSKPAVGRITVPAGFASGASPIHFERDIRRSDHLYLNAWIRFSANWKFNPIADAVFALWAGDQPRLFWGWRPDSSGQTVRPAALIITDRVEGGSRWLDPNLVPGTTIKRGEWHHVEFEVQSVAGSEGLGRFVCWLDGVRIASYDDVPYGVIEQNRHWGMIQVGPSWGGLTEPLDQSQTIDFDHIYLSDLPL